MDGGGSVAERLTALEAEQAALRDTLARTEAERERYRTLYVQLLEAYEKPSAACSASSRTAPTRRPAADARPARHVARRGRRAARPDHADDPRAYAHEAHGPQAPSRPSPQRGCGADPARGPGAGPHAVCAHRRGGERGARAAPRLRSGRARDPAEVRAQGSDPQRPNARPDRGAGRAPDRPRAGGTGTPGRHDRAALAGPSAAPSVYARDGVELARSTVCGWHGELAALARPLVDAMRADALAQPYLCTDATGVLVQAKDKCRTGHFWVLVAPALHVLFGYSPRHDSAGVDKLLAGYRGYLVADAHAVYDHLYADGTVVEVGCWAHQRRYLFSVSDAVRRTDTTRSGADRGRYPL